MCVCVAGIFWMPRLFLLTPGITVLRSCWKPGEGAVGNGPTVSPCAAGLLALRPGTSGTAQVYTSLDTFSASLLKEERCQFTLLCRALTFLSVTGSYRLFNLSLYHFK